MTVAWGILSTAKINELVLQGVGPSEAVKVLAVASRDPRRAEEYARLHGIERAYGSYESLLGDADVEAVYISLPNSMHVEWSIRALEAGKHVLCEKPLSRRADDVQAAFATAERAGKLLSEAFMYRHHPQTRRALELIGEGAIGRLGLIRSSFSFVLDQPENIRLRAALDGGALLDVGCYCVNASRLLAGEPERVFGEATLGGDGVDVRFAGVLRFPGDVLAHFDCGLALAERDELEVVGDEGSLFLDDPWHCRNPQIELRRGGTTERLAVEPGDPYRLELEEFSAAIRGNRPPLLGHADALGQARTIEALSLSAAEGLSITLAGSGAPSRKPSRASTESSD